MVFGNVPDHSLALARRLAQRVPGSPGLDEPTRRHLLIPHLGSEAPHSVDCQAPRDLLERKCRTSWTADERGESDGRREGEMDGQRDLLERECRRESGR
jgi:hypothetical protein